MKSIFITDNKKAYKLAKKYQPILLQGWHSIRDGLTPILLGKSETILSNLNMHIDNPVLYYSVRENDEAYFILYMKYHPFDYSLNNWPIIGKLIRKLDSHRHDTECFCLKVFKGNKRVDCVSVFHYQHLYEKDICKDSKKPLIYFEPEGHGIIPIYLKTFQKTCLKEDVRIYHKYKLENMLGWSKKYWNKLKEEFNAYGVKMPDEHFDAMLKLHTAVGRKAKLGHHEVGDIWNNPEKLFTLKESGI